MDDIAGLKVATGAAWIMLLGLIVIWTGAVDWFRVLLADILITLDIPVMTDHLGRFMSLL